MNIYYKFSYFVFWFGITFLAEVALGNKVHSVFTAQISTDSMLNGFVTNYMGIEQYLDKQISENNRGVIDWN